MKLTLRQQLTQFAHVLQEQLFPAVEEAVGELNDTGRRLIAVLEMIPLARFVPAARGCMGRPSKDRLAFACAFVAKAVYGFSLTRQLLERLRQDAQLRRICGWEHAHQVPHESTFSRAFAEFAAMELPQLGHEALIASTPERSSDRPHRPRFRGHRGPRAVSRTYSQASVPSARGPQRQAQGKDRPAPPSQRRQAARAGPKPILACIGSAAWICRKCSPIYPATAAWA
jgi:hypothetical protein